MTVDTRQQLLTQINSQIAMNGTGAITGPILNNILDTMVNSSLFNTGAWSQYTSYAPLDIVQYGGQSYAAIVANVAQTPSGTSTYWSQLSSTTSIVYTVATLPAGTLGMRAAVSDAVSPTFLGALTGGGTVKAPVFYNGTAWVAG